MKKLHFIIKHYLAIVFGALLLLIYLNWLAANGAALALGIVAIVLSAYYLVTGILGVVLGDKLPAKAKKILNLLAIDLFPAFMFTYFLLRVINTNQQMGPTAWTISILSMVGSIALVVVFSINAFTDNKLLARLTYLFGLIFVLVLLLEILFDANGNPVVLGNISVAYLILFVFYCSLLSSSFAKDEEAVEETPIEEPKSLEEEPKEE